VKKHQRKRRKNLDLDPKIRKPKKLLLIKKKKKLLKRRVDSEVRLKRQNWSRKSSKRKLQLLNRRLIRNQRRANLDLKTR